MHTLRDIWSDVHLLQVVVVSMLGYSCTGYKSVTKYLERHFSKNNNKTQNTTSIHLKKPYYCNSRIDHSKYVS